jgi:dihydroorotate dehydrogenase (fumarate)
MDLSTQYLGLNLRTPLVPSASPLSEDVDNLKRMEDAGAAAVVLHSLFEEQIRQERNALVANLNRGTESYPEALTYFPEPASFHPDPELYLDLVRHAKEHLRIPVIASLNGSTPGNWTRYARLIQEAGADALELNIYWIPTDPSLTGGDVEKKYLEIVRAVKSQVTIPLAVKLSPFFTSFANLAAQLVGAGARGLVLFNRFYQPDIDPETLEIRPNVLLSTPMASRLPLRWIALLHGRINANLAATGGIHRSSDVVRMLMAGADVTMLCSSLMRHGIAHLRTVETDLIRWLQEHEYKSVAQLKGSVSQKNCPDPAAFERAQYMRAVTVPASA